MAHHLPYLKPLEPVHKRVARLRHEAVPALLHRPRDLLSCDNIERTNLALTGRSCSQATFGPQSPPGSPSMGRSSVSDTTEYSFAVVALRPVEASAIIEGDADISFDVSSIDAAGEQLYTGDAAVALDVSAIAASGAVAIRGSATIAPPVSAIAASGTAPIGAGPASVVLPVSAIAASGGITTAGTGSLTFSVSSIAAAGGVTTSGAVAVSIAVSTPTPPVPRILISTRRGGSNTSRASATKTNSYGSSRYNRFHAQACTEDMFNVPEAQPPPNLSRSSVTLRFTRRQLFAAAAAGLSFRSFVRADELNPEGEPVAFFLVGDTHFLADKEEPARLDERSAVVTSRLVDQLNKLPGTEISLAAGGGKVLAPRGVIHAGDCIDTGDKANVKMQETEWAAFADDYGLTGKDGKLNVPVYEVHGNHDSPRGDGLAIKKIIARNERRVGVTNASKNGVHYSWDWGGVHFVNLGIVVGQAADVTRKRRYGSLGSLEFLVSDLKEKVGDSGKPVVITHHVDVLRYSQPLPVEDKKAEGMEWDPADVRGFHDALQGYTVAAILYGHTHARSVFRWDGSNKAAKDGIPTFNVDNSSHFASKQQAFFYFEIRGDMLIVREFQTTDAWETGTWTPQVWTAPIAARKPPNARIED